MRRVKSEASLLELLNREQVNEEVEASPKWTTSKREGFQEVRER